MEAVIGWVKDLKADLRISEDSPIGDLRVTVICKASEQNMLTLTRMSGKTVFISTEQPELFEGEDAKE